RYLDGKPVSKITAFLFHAGDHEDPIQLRENTGKSFVGSYVLGKGFTFDDTDSTGIASSIADMNMLLQEDPANAEAIFPYIGGDDVNSSPTPLHHRFVINFGDRSEEECRTGWPALMAIVEAKVRPERMQLAENPDGRRRKKYWWQFGRLAPARDAAIAPLQ